MSLEDKLKHINEQDQGNPVTRDRERQQKDGLAAENRAGTTAADSFSITDGLTRRYDDQSDVAAFRLPFHFFHNWPTTVRSGADHKPRHFQGYLFLNGQGCMSKLITDSLGR